MARSADTEEGRYGKVKQALSELGISVTAAAVTTCSASAFMLPNYMIPFQKIGAFICFDIIVSLLFAVFLFSAMLTLCGPRNRNHWNYCYRKDQKSVQPTDDKTAAQVELVYTNPVKNNENSSGDLEL